MPKKVVILGGGIGGMSAAHELVERGFEVHVYEKKRIPGGKARSVHAYEPEATRQVRFAESDAARGRTPTTRPWLPGEHGFRFFPRFYKHIFDTMERTPLPDGGRVVDNLVDTTQLEMCQYGKARIRMPARFPRSPADFLVIVRDFIHALGPDVNIPADEEAYFASKVWQIITSCWDRRMVEYERVGWWEFIGAAERSAAYQKFLGHGITRSLVAAKAERASTKTIGDIFVQLLFMIAKPGMSSDRVLNAPTNMAWINPWLDHLRAQGVHYHLGAEVKSFNIDRGELVSVSMEIDGQAHVAQGDYYLSAIPVERMAELITPELVSLDPSLASIVQLAPNVEWMNGVQLYLKRRVPVVHGHVIYIDSPWALTSISQAQFWKGIDLTTWADGQVAEVLSIDISDWNAKGGNGKTAMECTRQEIIDECWAQVKRSLNVMGDVVLRDEDLHRWFLDPDIHRDPKNPDRWLNKEPLLVNQIGTWALRPEAATRIPNLMLASDYVRTFTDLATMESANEAARRAVNAILDSEGHNAARCTIWNLHEPEVFLPFRAYDQARWNKGLPWDDTLAASTLAVMEAVQSTGLSDGAPEDDATHGATPGGRVPMPYDDAVAHCGQLLDAAKATLRVAQSMTGDPFDNEAVEEADDAVADVEGSPPYDAATTQICDGLATAMSPLVGDGSPPGGLDPDAILRILPG